MHRTGPPQSSPLLQQKCKEPTTTTVEKDPNHGQTKKNLTAHPRGCLSVFPNALAAILRGVARGWKAFANGSLRLWRKGWTAETCSCIFALLSLIGLVLTLMAHQDRPLPDWPQIVSINSIVSLFSMMIRAGVSMVLAEGISQSKWQWFRKARKLDDMAKFDSASRGAWGSVLFIFGLRIKKPYFIAAMGALVTVMSAFTGFAAQQLVVFNDCLRTDESAAVGIRRSNFYNASGERIAAQRFDEFLPMSVAMDVGILQPLEDTTTLLSYGCKTGNCTFPAANGSTFSTLATDHWCEDATSEVVEVPLNYDDAEYYGYLPTEFLIQMDCGGSPEACAEEMSSSSLNGTNGTAALTTDYEFTMRNGTKARNIGLSLPLSDNLLAYPPVKFLLAGWPGSIVTGVSQGQLGYNGTISTIGMIYISNSTRENYEYKAIRCGIYPTVNTMEATYHNGILKEKLIKSVRIGEDVAASGFDTVFRLATKQTLRNGTEITCDERTTDTPGYLPVAKVNIDAAPINTTYLDVEGPGAETVWYPEDCVWAMTLTATSSIRQHLGAIYDAQFLVFVPNGRSGSAAMRVLWNDGEMRNAPLDHVSSLMTNLTTAMNTVLRTHGMPGFNKPAEGTMWYTTTCININWTWVAFPATMIALSAIFLLLVHLESRGVESERLWKSSIMAMLFCEMDDIITGEARPVGRQRLEEVAASTSVSLEKDQGSLRLVARQA